ncbi:MAG: MFS transporter [Tepidiformaceae bacterium]
MTEPAVHGASSVPADAPEAAPGTRNPFSMPGYRNWWSASVVAGTGVGIQAVTVPLFIRDRVSSDHRPLAIALALICQTLPGAALALFGGVVADRVERRRILVRSYAVAAAVSLIYVALSGMETSVIWPVFILAAIVGGAGAFTNPARQSMMPQILHTSQLQNGVILGTMAFMAMLQFGGPTLGGLLADGPGLTFAFAVEVALLAAAAFLFSRIATDMPVPSGRSVRADLVEGLRYVRRSPALSGVLILGTVPGVFLIGPFAVTVVLFVQDVLHESDKYVGILWGSFGAGILAGSVLLTLIRPGRRGLMLCASVLMGGVLMGCYGFSGSLPLNMFFLFVSGIFGPAIFINFATALLQEHAERQMMGRVMSMYGLAFTASTPIGYAQAGVMATLFGPQVTIVVSAAAAAVIGILAMLFLRSVTRLR